MSYFDQVIGILNARFPGEFICKLGKQGKASGLEIRHARRDGYAFLYEPSSPRRDGSRYDNYLLSLHDDDDTEDDGTGRSEVWDTAAPEECVERLLPWAFPPEWTEPAAIDRAKEKQRLEALAAGLSTRGRIGVQVIDPDPDRVKLLSPAREPSSRTGFGLPQPPQDQEAFSMG
jgi:hypothetical protein